MQSKILRQGTNNGYATALLHDGGRIADGQSQMLEGRFVFGDGTSPARVFAISHDWVTARTYGPFGTLMFDIFFVTGDSRPNPLVFAALFPFYLGLSALDLWSPSKTGAAILGVARKP